MQEEVQRLRDEMSIVFNGKMVDQKISMYRIKEDTKTHYPSIKSLLGQVKSDTFISDFLKMIMALKCKEFSIDGHVFEVNVDLYQIKRSLSKSLHSKLIKSITPSVVKSKHPLRFWIDNNIATEDQLELVTE